MSLLKELEEDKKKLEELLEEEKDDKEEEKDTEEKPEDKTEEPPKTETKPEDDDVKPSSYVKLRKKNKELQDRLDAVEAAEIAAKKAKEVVPEKPQDQEPNKETNYSDWLEWNNRKNKQEIEDLKKIVEGRENVEKRKEALSQAERSFQSYESEFMRETKDYESVSSSYAKALMQSLKLLNPSITPDAALNHIKQKILLDAAEDERDGVNPAEGLYMRAKELGIKVETKEESKEEKKEEKKKADLSVVAQNQARNAGTAASKGTGGRPDLTMETAASLSPAEWAKLSKEEKRRVLGGRDWV